MSLSKIIFEKIEKEINSEIELLNDYPATVLGININRDLIEGTEKGLNISLDIIKKLLIEENF